MEPTSDPGLRLRRYGHGGRLYVYDSNKPHSFGDTGHTDPRTDIVSFDLSGSALRATSPSDQAGSTLAGFFCTNYAPVTPNAALATSFGEFLTFQFDPRSWMWVYGSLLPMTGGTGSEMSTQTVLPRTLPHPRDNALLRESSSAPVFLYQGGAPFWVPDPTQLSHWGLVGGLHCPRWNASRVPGRSG